VMLAGLDGHDLCIGRDGHVALELSDHRCCTVCPDHGTGDAHNALWTAGSGNCGDCVDIPLSFTAGDHHASHSLRALPAPQGANGNWQGTSDATPATCRWTICVGWLPPPRAVPDLSPRSSALRI
jgi:hypothetical protein